LIQQLRVALMDLMTSAGVIDAETDQPIRGSASDADQSLAFKQLLHTTDDLAALDKLEEVPITCLHLIIIQTKRNNLSRSLFWHLQTKLLSLSSYFYLREIRLLSLCSDLPLPFQQPQVLFIHELWPTSLPINKLWPTSLPFKGTLRRRIAYIYFWSVLKVYTIRYFSIAKLFLIALLRNNYLSPKCIGD